MVSPKLMIGLETPLSWGLGIDSYRVNISYKYNRVMVRVASNMVSEE